MDRSRDIDEKLDLGVAYYGEYKMELARDCAESVLTTDPTNPRALSLIAVTFIYEFEPTKARPFVELAIAVAPESPLTRWHLCELLMQEHKYSEAIPTLIALRSERIECGRGISPMNEYALAICYGGIGEFQQACTYFEQAIAVSESDVSLRILADYQEYKEAIRRGGDFFSNFQYPAYDNNIETK